MSQEQKYTVLVADDEPHARERLAQLLETLAGERPIGQIVQVENGMDAFEAISSASDETRPEIVFLDIHMPGMGGLEVAHHISKMRRPPLVVFVTSHDEHAIEAFENQALDYLLKPARIERLREVFSKIDTIAGARERISEEIVASAGGRTHLSVAERGKVRLIPVDEIVYLKAELKYTTIRTSEREYLTEEPLVGLENEFSGKFLRVHRNCLVPTAKLRGFERNKNEEAGWCVVVDGCPDKIPVSRRQWAVIREKNLF